MMNDNLIVRFRSRLGTMPQPVALAVGKVVRSVDDRELVDSTLKASEVVARYLAAMAAASFATREDVSACSPAEVVNFRGKLSFGQYADLIQGVARENIAHPLARSFAVAFKVNGIGHAALRLLVQIRNGLGHDLRNLSAAKASIVLRQDKPLEALESLIEESARLLDLPLFLFEDISVINRKLKARRLLLMGEGEPVPDVIEPSESLDAPNVLYVGHDLGALKLNPFLRWDVIPSRSSYGLFFLDHILVDDEQVNYVSVWDDELKDPAALQELTELLDCRIREAEKIVHANGVSLLGEWLMEKKIREQQSSFELAPVIWTDFDQATLLWYEDRLKMELAKAPTESKAKVPSPGSLIQKVLLDGRSVVNRSELKQLHLLFGNSKTVARMLGHPTVDCRAVDPSQGGRWQERLECTANLVESFRHTVEFLGRHVSVKELNLDGLKPTSGNADYVAIREALVNLFIHQDYSAGGPSAQIEIGPYLSVFHNAGASLVSAEGLIDGGFSTSRNPIIARALRLIGFAELAGSGLRAVHQAWRQASRRPPEVDSNASANTFTITLDSRLVAPPVDAFWQQRLGVKLTHEQAKALDVLHALDTLTASQVASGANLRLTEAQHALAYLKVQALVIETEGRFHLRPDLAPLLVQKDSNG
jgi:predicted HTH transcriptional regulator